MSINFEKELAENHMFHTWEASINGEICIVKRIPIPEKQLDKLSSIKQKFETQLSVSKKIAPEDKESIVLYDRCEDYSENGAQEILYIRPFIQGTLLSDKIRESKFLDETEAIQIILAVARVISTAHNKYGLYHGDLKPENIIIRDNSLISVIDWDTMSTNRTIQEDMSDGRTLAFAEIIAGTPQYMAPEQCETLKSTEKGDVYALGMIFYKMLTGKTPFDNLIPAEIPAKKRDQIVPLNVAFASKIHISEDISQIIDEALCIDPNSRTQSVDSFINAIENFLRAPSVDSPNQESNNHGDIPLSEKQSSDEYNLVLVGHSHAGKTVLAAGLYATASDEFSVEAKDLETRKFADNTKTLLSTHKWPDHTGKKGKNLAFTLYYKGKSANIYFKEYAGEALKTLNYCKDYLKNPDGVFLLLNPNIMELDVLARNDMVSSIKAIITYLSSLTPPPPIALVVTASDRLKTDFKDKASDFNKIVIDVEHSIKSKGITSNKYEVSVTGELENQQNPVLNPSNVQSPFMWILSQRGKKSWTKIVKICSIILSILLCILGGCALGRYAYESWMISSLSHSITDDVNNFNAKTGDYKNECDEDRQLRHLKMLSRIRASYCTAGHICKEGSNAGSQNGECDRKCSPFFLYNNLGRQFKTNIDGLEEKIDQVKHDYLRFSLKKTVAAACTTKSKFKENAADPIEKDILNLWFPLSGKGDNLKSDLIKDLKKELPQARERNKFFVCENALRAIVSNKLNSFPQDAQKSIDDLPSQSVLPPEERKQRDESIAGLLRSAKQSIERQLYSKIHTRLISILQDGKCQNFHPDIDRDISRLPSKEKTDLEPEEYARLDKNLKDMRRQAREAVATRISQQLITILNGIVRNPAKGFPSEFDSLYQKWVQAKPLFEVPDDAKKIDDVITASVINARKSVFCYETECIRKELGAIQNSAPVSQWAELVGKVQNFLAKKQDQRIDVLQDENKKTTDLLWGRVRQYVLFRCDEFDKSQMATKEKIAPDFKNELTSTLLPVLPQYKEELVKIITTRVASTQEKWNQAQHEKVSVFIRTISEKNAFDSIFALSEFCYEKEEMGNPYLIEAENCILEKAHDFLSAFVSKVSQRNISDDDFIQAKELCAGLSGKKLIKVCRDIVKYPLYQWAIKYLEWKKDNPKFTVSFGALQCIVSYERPDKPYFRDFYCKASGRILKQYHSDGWNTTRFNTDKFISFADSEYWPPSQEDFVVGRPLDFYADVWDCRGDDWRVGNVLRTFFPGVEDIPSAVDLSDSTSRVTVRLYLNVSGKPFSSWLRDNPLPSWR